MARPGIVTDRPLDDVHRRLEAVLNNASVAILLMDDRQRCIFMNSAAEKLTGFTFAEVVALDRPLHDIIHHTHPDGTPFPLEECVIDRAFPEHNQMQGEEIFVHKDGSFYPVAFTASPVRDEESQTIGTIIEVRDTTQQKLANERQRLLLNELNHRVKNTLSTVQSIAWQTFKHVDPIVKDVFDGRLSTLSRAHNILTESAWQKAALADIVETAIETFGKPNFTVEGCDHDVPPKAALTLSMVLHELGTNSIKYGALSKEGGHIHLACEMDRGNSDQRLLRLVWEERGGPRVERPERRGFGMRLIERQLGMEFGGKATMDWRPEGLHCAMHLVMPDNSERLEFETTAAPIG